MIMPPLACVFYIDWAAERRAKIVCQEIALGSDISEAIRTVRDKKDFYGDSQQYTLYFWGLVFDKAVCKVSIDPNRRVTAKHSEMEYD